MTPEDKDLPAGVVPFGKRPALIVVDMSNGFVSPESPLGGQFDKEVEAAGELVEAFKHSGLPVFFSTVVYSEASQQRVFRQHLPDLDVLAAGTEWVDIDARLGVTSEAQIIEKTAPSAFFNTPLQAKLCALNADSLVVCGLTTSGCVRATAVDGLSHDYPVWVAVEACGDRNRQAHDANLHDLEAKYADVVSQADILAYLQTLSKESCHG